MSILKAPVERRTLSSQRRSPSASQTLAGAPRFRSKFVSSTLQLMAATVLLSAWCVIAASTARGQSGDSGASISVGTLAGTETLTGDNTASDSGAVAVTSGSIDSGSLTLGSGAVTVTSGSILELSSTLYGVVADSGASLSNSFTGGLVIESGATAVYTNGFDGSLGLTGDSTLVLVGDLPAGTLTVGAGETLTSGTGIFLGSSAGEVENILVDAGGKVSSAGVIGNLAGASGTVNVSGSGALWTSTSSLIVGNYSSNATLSISGGGTLSLSGSAASGLIGANAGSNGAASVTGAGSVWTDSGDLSVGASGSGTLMITSGAAVTNGATIFGAVVGNDAGSAGNATVTGSGSAWTDKGNLFVGAAGGGTLLVSNGGSLSDYYSFIGDYAGSSGAVTVTGSGSKWTETGDFSIGASGTGTLTISGGGAVTNGAAVFGAVIGNDAGSCGNATVTGSGSAWTDKGNLFVGAAGTGALLISNGGSLSDYYSYIGDYAGSNGAVTVTGSGSKWTETGDFSVGASGTGTLTISGGGTVTNGAAVFGAVIGNYAGSTGSVTVTGSGSTWTDKGNLFVGAAGSGTLLVSNGGSASDYNAYVGDYARSSGTVTVTGSGSKWIDYANLSIGAGGTGTLTVTGGGVVDVGGETTIGSAGTLAIDGGSTFHTGSLEINGGTVRTLGAATFAPSATLGAGGITVDTGGFNSTFSGAFSGAGGLTKEGGGTLTVTGASTYSGATRVNSGGLALETTSAGAASLGNTAINVASGATFAATLGASPLSKTVTAGTAGSGSSGATLTLGVGSTFSMAGASLATFNLEQENSFSGPAFTIGGASGIAPSLIFDIGNAATGTDLLNVTKTVSVLQTGGEITIDALAGDTSLTAGNYDLITSAGGFSGTGGNGLALSGTTLAVGGTTYDLSLSESSTDDEILTVSASTPSTPVSLFSLRDASSPDAIGSTPASHAAAPLVATEAIPEPCNTASLLTAFGIASACLLRRRSRK
jgi:T5SS/PEP-CTERM-associated repeat protein/autotransporter-associated beta strand protein